MSNHFPIKAASVTSPPANIKRARVVVPPSLIEAEILSVSWGSGIVVSRKKTAVTAPHWELGQTLDEVDTPDDLLYRTGSQKPGAYVVKAKAGTNNKAKVKVRIKRAAAGMAATLTLKGELKGLKFQGDCPSSVGEHEVSVEILNLPDTTEHYQGDARWSLEDPASKASSALAPATRLELFVLLDAPTGPFATEVWAEALRFLFIRAGLGASAKADAAIRKITRYCHGKHGLHYDTQRGASFFGGDDGLNGNAFQLMRYMQKKSAPICPASGAVDDGRTVNCYDQACAVQTLACSLGIPARCYYQNPFGFINKTDLIGVGACNNPFYSSNGTSPMIGANDPNRTQFGNHAFAHLATRVEDACAGPHHNETLKAYLTGSIDVPTTMKTNGIAGKKPEDYIADLIAGVYEIPGAREVK
ncbi:hypothetical protein SAMN04487939_10672 [Lysobacter sp. yr284]|uniref:hypothetical protein n=1 Tax=Lysobacter sp. yr284 TaxID=1761791 RepID=UPI000895D380|nr:hypothetical protein [Lysobacter sp. yr284]SDY78531.1 hypothetical protein SAMN04487939_10672 [Lysobacter sp. yr284]